MQVIPIYLVKEGMLLYLLCSTITQPGVGVLQQVEDEVDALCANISINGY